ncbi:MAG: methionine synthase [Candidatus Caldatribacteriaceae bacterium]
MSKKILGASLGSCVHVAGVYRFLQLAEQFGYQSVFLGPAVSIEDLILAVEKERPQKIMVGYRLYEEAGRTLFRKLKEALGEKNLRSKMIVMLSCTPALREIAQEVGIFDFIFTGEESFDDIVSSLQEIEKSSAEKGYPQTLPERILWKRPFPILRHHLGLPTVAETAQGVAQISEAKVLDVISLGPDQNAQEFFFHPENMRETEHGAGGVPLRRKEDLEIIYQASRRGNFPLLRCYSGTQDLVRWAHLLKETINIAWGAVPIFWYSILDGRSKRSLEEAIRENQEATKTYIALSVPIEGLEAHQWSLRDAPDSVAVASFYLACYQAKKFGARFYVAQYMFNTPPGIDPWADIAKMLAKKELVEELEDENFSIFTQVRGGLAHFAASLEVAKGQLGATISLGLFLKPHIVHVVGFSEGVRLVGPNEVIESAHIAQGVLRDLCLGLPEIGDHRVKERKEELKEEARLLLQAVRSLGEREEDPWTSPKVLAEAVRRGLFDAPHLQGNPEALGRVKTQIVEGVLRVVNEQGEIISERERLRGLGF